MKSLEKILLLLKAVFLEASFLFLAIGVYKKDVFFIAPLTVCFMIYIFLYYFHKYIIYKKENGEISNNEIENIQVTLFRDIFAYINSKGLLCSFENNNLNGEIDVFLITDENDESKNKLLTSFLIPDDKMKSSSDDYKEYLSEIEERIDDSIKKTKEEKNV